MPGLIRASFGLYNERDEIDAFIQALKEISQGRYQGTYVQERASGEYKLVGWEPDYDRFLSF
jgi:hypothetical protein